MSLSTNTGAERALSYHDVLLRKADLELLAPGRWLNDQIIAFFFELLLRKVHPSLVSTVALIPPAMSFLLLQSAPQEAAVIFEALKLQEKQLVLFAVNDNPNVEEAGGGSHWSCLAFHRASNTFRHYDSLAHHNHHVAQELAGAAAPLVRNREPAAAAAAAAPGSGSTGSSSSSCQTLRFPAFVEVAAAPQQRNMNDCGVYVLAVAQQLCEALSKEQLGGTAVAGQVVQFEQQEKEALCSITPAAVLEMRQQVLHTIQQLAAEQQQQQQ